MNLWFKTSYIPAWDIGEGDGKIKPENYRFQAYRQGLLLRDFDLILLTDNT